MSYGSSAWRPWVLDEAAAQRARTMTVHDADLAHVGDEGVVEELGHAVDRLIDRAADDVQFAQQSLARLQVDADPYP